MLTLQRLALMIGALVAYYFIGNYVVHGPAQDEPEIVREARCERARINANKGNADPQLLSECRQDGYIR